MYTKYTQHPSRQCTLHSPSKCHPLHNLNSIVYHLSLFADTTSKCHYTASLHHMYQTPFPDNTPLQDIKVSSTRQSLASAPVYVPVPWTSHICACSLCNATHKFCASFQQKNSSCIHLTLDPCTGLLMQPRFSEENYATQFVRQRLVALFWSFQPFLSIFTFFKFQNVPTSYGVLQFEICMIHIDRGRKAPSGAFAKKFFPLPSVPICWPTSYCVRA